VIHPTAIIHPAAKVDSSVSIGPGVVIDEGVEIGPGCALGPHVYVTGITTIGANNRFHAGCVIGDSPQDLKYDGQPTRLRIGDGNVFREHATVHRSTKTGAETVIGSRNYLMQHSHVAHNCIVGDQTIIAGGAILAGHAVVQDRAFISGNCLVHQFTRVGTLAMMQGGSAISKDLPPFTVARGDNGICGLNTVGLRRAGFTPAQRLELKQVYHALFRSGRNLRQALADARMKFPQPPSSLLIEFVASASRGVCRDFGVELDDADPEP
jgi:UDP-N-acetylglucosamine acyltransferase